MGNGATLTRYDGIPTYAERFTAAGFTVVAFDYRHWGDSGGEPRGWFRSAASGRTGKPPWHSPGLCRQRSRDPPPGHHADRGRAGRVRPRAGPEAVPGFTSVTAGRQWRNEITTSWVFPAAAFRPVRMAPRIQAPVLYQIGDHDGMAPATDIEKAAHRTPKAEVRHYEMDHFGCFTPQHLPIVADDECTFLRARLLPA